MGIYLNAKHQREMECELEEYLRYKDSSEYHEIKLADKALSTFFLKVDLIIKGIIYSPTYNFWQYTEIDDLIQEARLAVLISIQKNQFDKSKGSIFNFFSTVVSQNLMNFTKKITNKNKKKTFVDISEMHNIAYLQNFNKEFLLKDAFKILRDFFKGKQRFVELTDLLEKYYTINAGSNFIKKNFVSYANAYGYSAASVNMFFNMIKRLKHQHNDLYSEIQYIFREIA